MPKSAFTLLELLMVITIVVILIAAMAPLFKTTRVEAKIAKAKQDLEALAAAARQCYFDTGLVILNPNSLANVTSSIPGWKGPYIAQVNLDPWGEPYAHHSYTYVDDSTKLCYKSNGPNKYNDGCGVGCGGAIDEICVTVLALPPPSRFYIE